MSAVPVTLACWDYDRTRALQDGRIAPRGVDLTYLPLAPEETFYRMLRWQEFDAAEMSLSSYLLTLGEAEPPFVAIPAFPSRVFRHGSIYVRADSPHRTPSDLRGGVVGVPEYQITAAVWIRGILQEWYDLPVQAVRYRTGGLHDPGRVEKLRLHLPPDVDVASIPAGRTLDEMLVAGELDAVYTARAPRSFRPGGPLRRLFDDVRAEEESYAARTGIFPIMHVVVLRRDVYARHRWLARSLLDAFEVAKRDAMAGLDELTALKYLLPWTPLEAERTRSILAEDFWPYGVPANRHVLETFIGYSHAQGLARRRYSPEEIFAEETIGETLV